MNWRAISKPVVIAAASARPFVRAAVAAGYQTIAADVFCDADTQEVAAQAEQLRYRCGGFDPGDLKKKLFPLLSQAEGFVYGSGFETQPELLDEMAVRCRLLGNSAATVRQAKDPGHFFALLSRLHIPFPETSLRPPAAPQGWLQKSIGGSGGTHVKSAMQASGADFYYQRLAPGKPFSLLFLANGTQARAVGYNAQLMAPTVAMPYRYGGAVSQAELPLPVRSDMLQAAQQLTTALGLRGLNSLDCMVEGDHFRVLEINPRLSASFALYDAANQGGRLFKAHLRACAGELEQDFPPEPAQAHLIYYAPFDLAIPVARQWPPWVADVPAGASRILAGEPVCTVTAEAPTAQQAVALAQTRTLELAQRMTSLFGN